MKLLSRAFWQYAFERAVKTGAQSALSLMTVDYTGVLDVDYKAVASAAGLAAIISVLTSLTSAASGTPAPEPASEPDPDRTQVLPPVQ